MLKFNEEKHIYTYNDKPVPSVTQVMSRVGVRKDSDSHFNPISGGFIRGGETASNFGRAFHKVAELIIQGKKIKAPGVMYPWIEGLEKFIKDYPEIEVDRTEYVGYSTMYNFAGTMDVLGTYKGEPIIIDWKTSTSVSKTWDMQTAAYEQLAREEFGIRKMCHRWAVQIKENDYHVVKRYNNKSDFNKFLSILNVLKAFG